MTFSIASVLLDVAIDKSLDYLIPASFQSQVQIGTFVQAPLRGVLRKGIVVELKQTSDFVKLQSLHSLLRADPLLTPDVFELALWMTRYYCTPLRKVLKVLLPPSIRKNQQPKEQLIASLQISRPEAARECALLQKKHPSQALVLEILIKEPKGVLLTKILESTKTSRSPVDSLVKKGLIDLQKQALDFDLHPDKEFVKTKPQKLNPEQAICLEKINTSLETQIFSPFLLFGITGSGKTEVYLQSIEKALSLGKSTILLVPEISLTTQTISRFRCRFGDNIAVLHHRQSPIERKAHWDAIRNGDIQIVIGPRSAIFSPVKNLGLIIVDEEHEQSYKQQDDMPCYHARDVSMMRGFFSKATVILGTATPSLETFYNVHNQKYQLLTMTQRADNAVSPLITIVDMQKEKEKQESSLFSSQLLEGIQKRLEQGEQIIIFLNRRGYNTSCLCLQCNQALKCPHCATSLSFHKKENFLLCHLCLFAINPAPHFCPTCKSSEPLKYQGAGTQRVENTLKALFPDLKTLRMDADTTRHQGSHEHIIQAFKSGKADLLIGTQMIAKGLHFPRVTLVGVLNSDASLTIPDFRSSEYTFQLLVQIAGRSGRGNIPGEVIIQTNMPQHPIIKMASEQNYQHFFEEEMKARDLFNYPPKEKIVRFLMTGKQEALLQHSLEEMRHLMIEELGPAYEIQPIVPCGYVKVKDSFRYQFMIKGPKTIAITKAAQNVLQKKYPSPHCRLIIDPDPTTTFF